MTAWTAGVVLLASAMVLDVAALVPDAWPAETLLAAQPAPAPAGHADADEPAADHEAEEHGSGLLQVVARLVNFGILAGVLVYFLRVPLASHLRDRGDQIRADLVTAASTREAAARQLEEIDRRLAALPGEIETLKERGTQEVAAERARIADAAAVERRRLLEQTEREVGLQLRVAKRELVRHAAGLAVEVAAGRLRQVITEEDQVRLADRYLAQVQRRAGR